MLAPPHGLTWLAALTNFIVIGVEIEAPPLVKPIESIFDASTVLTIFGVSFEAFKLKPGFT
ncbi:hypothetical protein D3C80_1771950 [compost metagenome]